MRTYYIYIMASKKNGALYLGVTNDLVRRVWQHKNDIHDGFTKKYNVNRLVYYEETNDIESAISREKRLKKWNREWKEKLITDFNPGWIDLAKELNEPQF